MNNNMGLKSNEVRLIQLKPMRVACYRAYSESPEDNPCPDGKSPAYGYEVWATVPDDIKEVDESAGIQIKTFEGGLLAVTCTSLDTFDVGERWQRLVQWVNNSEFEISEKQFLEEHISPKQRWEAQQLQLDLYLAIKQKA